MFMSEATPVLDALTIHYLVPHSPSSLEEASPFQLISPGVLDTAGAFDVIARLPRDATELLHDSNELVAARIAGRGYSVFPLPMTVLSTAIGHLANGILVILSMRDEIAATVADAVSKISLPIFHATASQQPTRAAIREHCLRVAEFWKKLGPGFARLGNMLAEGLSEWHDPIVQKKLDFESFTHLLTAPNLTTLAAAGYRPRPAKKTLISTKNGPYYDGRIQF